MTVKGALGRRLRFTLDGHPGTVTLGVAVKGPATMRDIKEDENYYIYRLL